MSTRTTRSPWCPLDLYPLLRYNEGPNWPERPAFLGMALAEAGIESTTRTSGEFISPPIPRPVESVRLSGPRSNSDFLPEGAHRPDRSRLAASGDLDM